MALLRPKVHRNPEFAPTHFKAASGTMEILTALPTDLQSLASLAAWSGNLEAGGCGVWEEVREAELTPSPREYGQTLNCESRSPSLAHGASTMQASFALALGQVISVHNLKSGMFNSQHQRKTVHARDKLIRSKQLQGQIRSGRDPHEHDVNTYAGRKVAPSRPAASRPFILQKHQ